MLQIFISSKFQKEKEYIISVLLTDFMGFKYQVNIDESQENYLIQNQNQTISIQDDFFNKVEGNYISKNNIPKDIKFNSDNTPIIYGSDIYKESENHIELGLDIFGSSFFMLTRWEEIAITDRDNHNRFKTSSSLAYKNKFHRRPKVNEYVELLWNCLTKIAVPPSTRKKREYKIQFSHDVDHPQLFPSFGSFIKQIGFQILKKGNIGQALKFANFYFSSNQDPYDTFGHLMDISEKHNTISQFNFMNCSNSEFEEGYDISSDFNQRLIKKIKERGHQVGFHPSYKTYNNAKLWKHEKVSLEKETDQKVKSGRQHYLGFENPTTWNIWEDNEMSESSTLGYADEVGFRAGTCYSYHPFDVIKRKKLDLLETPLILMEGALIHHLKSSPEDFLTISNQLKEEVKKFSGIYNVLWHNSSFFLAPYHKYESLLSKI